MTNSPKVYNSENRAIRFFEIMKKIFTILLVGVACLALSSCGANKNDGESVKKGDGSNWYVEPISIGAKSIGLIHSTFDCPTVKNGVIPNVYRSGKKYEHSFCTKCMNEELIEKWYEWFEEGEKEK